MSNGADDAGNQLQASLTHIDSLHAAITQAISDLGHEFTAAIPDITTHLAEQEQRLVAIPSAVTTEVSPLVDGLKPHYTAFNTAILNVQHAFAEHKDAWTHSNAAFGTGTKTFEATLVAAQHGSTAILSNLGQGLDTASHGVQDIFAHFESLVVKQIEDMAHEASAIVSKAAADFHDGIAGATSEKFKQDLSSIFHDSFASIAHLAATSLQITEDMIQVVPEMFAALAQIVADVEHRLEAAAEHLVKEAVASLTSNVTTAFVETTAGASVTGAMAPVLPEVVIVKEASEAIKDLVHVFKAVAKIF